jgi:hypothetical protein
MKPNSTKNNPTVGCCGIDCGLCSRFHTVGKSKCPGCAGVGFFDKHPSCSVLTCCFLKKKMETCGNCEEFICSRIADWDSADSFVTHRACISNLKRIKESGLPIFVRQQQKRLELLEELIQEYDDGRSKSFYCLSTALLPLKELNQAMQRIKSREDDSSDRKRVAKSLREAFAEIANKAHVELSYRRKT